MIIVPVKDGENIERARLKMEHAIYVQQLRANEE